MINQNRYVLFYIPVLMLCSACASNTFTQQGKVSSEEICYQQQCYSTIYWEDGSYSSIEKEVLPDSQTVYRHCYVASDGDIVCRPNIYKQPILLFDNSLEDIIENIEP